MKLTSWVGLGSLAASLALAAPQDPQTRQPSTPQDSKSKTTDTPSDKPIQADASLMDQGREVFSNITAAQQALGKKDDETARQRLARARQILEELYSSAQGSDVLEEVQKAHEGVAQGQEGIDFAPLSAVVQNRQVFMDPQVVAGVDKAQKQYQDGNARQSSETLRLAQDALVTDMALLPVEASYARVIAAQSLLEEGKREEAGRLLGGVPITLQEWQVRSPLVTVRFNLRAAAAAADAKDPTQVQTLITTASTQFQQVMQAAQSDFAKQLKPIGDQLKRLRTQAENGKQVKGDDLRSLADRTRDLSVTPRPQKPSEGTRPQG